MLRFALIGVTMVAALACAPGARANIVEQIYTGVATKDGSTVDLPFSVQFGFDDQLGVRTTPPDESDQLAGPTGFASDPTFSVVFTLSGSSYTFSLGGSSAYAVTDATLMSSFAEDPDFDLVNVNVTGSEIPASLDTPFTGNVTNDVSLFFVDGISGTLYPSAVQIVVDAAPEPSTWALMIAGLAAIGLALRRARIATNVRVKDAFSA